MPKIKTHSGAKKRFTVTKNGKFKLTLPTNGAAVLKGQAVNQ